MTLRQQIGRAAISSVLDTMLDIDGNDEIGQLLRQYNFMIRSIKELIEEVKRTNRQKEQLELKQQEIKLKMLASQINPHFLFNALESIRMQAHIKGQKEIAGVVKMLGRLMRKSLETQGHHIPLKDEIDMVRSSGDSNLPSPRSAGLRIGRESGSGEAARAAAHHPTLS